MRMRNSAYWGTLEDDDTLKWKFYNEWCFWTLHWCRPIALRFCTIVPVGSALPGDVWLRYWFELMTHGLNNFQQTDGLLIWGLRFLPSSTTPKFIINFCSSVRVHLTICFYHRHCLLTGIGGPRGTASPIWKEKKNKPLNILQQAAYRSYSRMKFYCVVNSTWWIWWSAAGATLRPLKPITLITFGVHYLKMYSIMIKSALRYHAVAVRLFP